MRKRYSTALTLAAALVAGLSFPSAGSSAVVVSLAIDGGGPEDEKEALAGSIPI